MKNLKLAVAIVVFAVLHGVASAAHNSGRVVRNYEFVLSAINVTRLCASNKIIVVNGKFPGPTVRVNNGDTVIVKVINNSIRNATIHWHGVRQMRNGWADGPEHITQCAIQPGGSYTYNFTITDQEGTLWWHAHCSWLRATVYGALIIDPKPGTSLPYTKPDSEQTLLLGEYYKTDPIDIINNAIRTGAAPNASNSLTINAQPGDLLPCSNSSTFRFKVTKGEKVLLRVINAGMNTDMFFAVANHTLEVVGADANYVNPFKTSYIILGTGQTTDVLLTAIRRPCGLYYAAAYAYISAAGAPFGNTTTTAILEYSCRKSSSSAASPVFPVLPARNDTDAVNRFSRRLRSPHGSATVPRHVDVRLFYTVSVGVTACPANATCAGPLNQKFAASMNNYSFVLPNTAVLQAHYYNISGVYTTDFPDTPPLVFNYTSSNLSTSLDFTTAATKTRVLKYNSSVELVLQGTSILGGESHPIHLHGYNFFVLATGSGNYNSSRDTAKYNLKDPPLRNTVNVPVNSWAVIRFIANNPGAWFLHCHLDAHIAVGLAMVFIVEDGPTADTKVIPPPADLPKC